MVTLSAAQSSSPVSGDSLSYQWRQTTGPSVTLSSATASSLSFTAPTVSSDTQLSFELVVSNGRVASKAAQANISVQHKAPAKSGGGGGAMGWLLLLLGGALAARRKA
ncbi:GlyGly-CTERM sorting domain-containing protein [Gallaecimonas kandeliae]|uniref:PKD domain-containing protein n=1 Tax=Gallaecimonas kandeliae TaxID=3029055 RepID=UPI002648BB11|nr:GlyGly-CTERM sorting domain-containing protein [Gallaecimonas kandeliae]WKE65877.1 GlyGly-CTERM sorting domain-containing protein [Gallaecimonas kandeliae]